MEASHIVGQQRGVDAAFNVNHTLLGQHSVASQVVGDVGSGGIGKAQLGIEPIVRAGRQGLALGSG